MRSKITIEKITTREDFNDLESVWNGLLEASSSNSITLTWEWLSTWWDVFGEGRELYILLVRDGKELIGIAPLLKRTVRHYGVLPYRRLEFLGSGEDEADEICSDYLDFILLGGREAESLRAIFEFLHKQDRDWDEFILTDISGESPNLPFLETLCEASDTKFQTLRDQICVYVPLPGDWETFMSGLSRDFRRKIRKERRTLESLKGEVRLIESLKGFDEHFEILIRLHQARWTSRGRPGVFSSERFTRFHRLLAPKALQKGWLKLFVLFESGEPAAALYDFIYNNKMYYYQSGLILEGGRISSPGVLIRSFAVEKAIEMGLRECDFLKGEPGSYKFRWGAESRSIRQLRLARAHSKEAVFSAADRVIAHLREARRSLRSAAS